MNMVPGLETDVVGRHGEIGVDIFTHDTPVVDDALRSRVDELFERVDHPDRPVGPEVRRAQVAVADTVAVNTRLTGNYL